MKIRHEIGKSVIVHDMEPGIDRLYVESLREGRAEEMEAYLQDHRADLMKPRTCRLCMQSHVPGELSKESFKLGWALGNTFEDMCMVCYSQMLLNAFGEIEKERMGKN